MRNVHLWLQKAGFGTMDQVAKIRQTLERLGFAKIGAIGAVAAAVLLGVVWIATHAQGPMGLLYSGLDVAEAGRIGQKLDELKVPYQVQGDGSVLLVPRDQVAHVRMQLAAAGLPSQSGSGYELLDQQSPMNMTSFMQRVQRTRALEGELARTIVALGGVRTARVHIVMPERDTFARDALQPTASVAVVMSGPMRLSASQAAAIRLLVAGAVPGLQRDAVSVLDPSGVVLGADNGDVPAGDRLAQVAASREQALQAAVTNLLEPLAGHGKVRVSASVAIDTSRQVTQATKYDPLSQVERSKQTQTDQDRTEDSRQRPAVSVAQNLPNQAPPAADGNGEQSTSTTSHNGQTINYEINTVHDESVREPGDTRRVSVAVLVDGTLDAKGVYQPPTREQLDRIAELTRAAVGYDAKRGDVVTVDTMRFVADDAEGGSADHSAEPAQSWAWAAPLGVVIVLFAGGAILLMFLRRRRPIDLVPVPEQQALVAAQPQPSGNLPATLLEARTLVEQPPQAIAGPLAGLHELIDARPDEALAVLRAWIAEAA
jgi:flagellar M-ring protein FliF